MAITNKEVFHILDFDADPKARATIEGLRRAYVFGPITPGATIDATSHGLLQVKKTQWRNMIRSQEIVFTTRSSLSTPWRNEVCSSFRPFFAGVSTILANKRISSGDVALRSSQPWSIEFCSNGPRSLTKTWDNDVLVVPIWTQTGLEDCIDFQVKAPGWESEVISIDDEWCGCWWLRKGTPIEVTVDDDAVIKEGLIGVMLITELC